MIKAIRYISCLSLLFVLSNCTTISANYNAAFVRSNDLPAVEERRKGAVIFTLTEEDDGKIKRLDYSLVKISDGKIVRNKYKNYRISELNFYPFTTKNHDYAKSILFLEPGLYMIERIDLVPFANGNVIHQRWYGPSLYNKKGLISFGGFEVKAGEVLNIGRIDVTKGRLRVFSEKKKVTTDLSNTRYNNLIPKIESGVFYEAGSLFNTYKDKKGNLRWEIIPRKEFYNALRKINRAKASSKK